MEPKRGRRVCGSWLMDEKALNELEKVAQSIYSYLCDKRDKIEKNMSEKQLEEFDWRYLKRIETAPQIEVTFSDETHVKKSMFEEIVDLLEVREKVPRKIEIKLSCMGIEVKLTLSSGDFSSNYFSYEVSNDEKYDNFEKEKNIIIGKIENWIDEFKPNWLSLIWYKLAGFSTLGILFMLIIFFVVLIGYDSSQKKYLERYDNEVSVIMQEGITDSNRDKAMELILAKQYEYIPKEWVQENSARYDSFIYIWLLLFAALWFLKICPKSNFFIGKGKQRVRFWRQYQKVIFVAIPTMIIIPIVINLITA